MKGQGHPGFCRLCVSDLAPALNKLIEGGRNAAEAKKAMQVIDPSFTFARQTFYSHKEHVTHPLVTAADQARKNPIVPKTSTGGLEMIRDLALARAADHPDEVTIDHGLKAMSELNRKQTGTDQVLIIFAKILSGEQSAEVIVGEYRELPALTQEEPPLG